MIQFALIFALTFFSAIGFHSDSQAGPIIVGNSSGLSEFNLLLVKRELHIWTRTCRGLPTCELKLRAEEWTKFDEAETWLRNSQFLFVGEQNLPGKTYEVQAQQNAVRFNKSALWVKTSSGELRGFSLSEATQLLFQILKTESGLPASAIDDVRSEIILLLDAQTSQYDVVLSNHYRLTVTKLATGLAGLALIRDHEELTQIEFFDLTKSVQCLSDPNPRRPGVIRSSNLNLNDLTYAHFTGPFLPNPDITMSFYGALTYDCTPDHGSANESWRESARLRFLLKIQEVDSGQPSQSYILDPLRSRVRFDSITSF